MPPRKRAAADASMANAEARASASIANAEARASAPSKANAEARASAPNAEARASAPPKAKAARADVPVEFCPYADIRLRSALPPQKTSFVGDARAASSHVARAAPAKAAHVVKVKALPVAVARAAAAAGSAAPNPSYPKPAAAARAAAAPNPLYPRDYGCPSTPCRRFGNRIPNEHRPTLLDLSPIGLPQARLFLCNAEWALHQPFLDAVGCTLLWEALDKWCRHRDAIDLGVEDVLNMRRELHIEYLNWYHHSGIGGDIPRPCNTRLRIGRRTKYLQFRHDAHHEVAAPFDLVSSHVSSGTVVCFCVEGKHRSAASIVAWLVAARCCDFNTAMGIVQQHPDCDVARYRGFSQLVNLELVARRDAALPHAARAASGGADVEEDDVVSVQLISDVEEDVVMAEAEADVAEADAARAASSADAAPAAASVETPRNLAHPLWADQSDSTPPTRLRERNVRFADGADEKVGSEGPQQAERVARAASALRVNSAAAPPLVKSKEDIDKEMKDLRRRRQQLVRERTEALGDAPFAASVAQGVAAAEAKDRRIRESLRRWV